LNLFIYIYIKTEIFTDRTKCYWTGAYGEDCIN